MKTPNNSKITETTTSILEQNSDAEQQNHEVKKRINELTSTGKARRNAIFGIIGLAAVSLMPKIASANPADDDFDPAYDRRFDMLRVQHGPREVNNVKEILNGKEIILMDKFMHIFNRTYIQYSFWKYVPKSKRDRVDNNLLLAANYREQLWYKEGGDGTITIKKRPGKRKPDNIPEDFYIKIEKGMFINVNGVPIDRRAVGNYKETWGEFEETLYDANQVIHSPDMDLAWTKYETIPYEYFSLKLPRLFRVLLEAKAGTIPFGLAKIAQKKKLEKKKLTKEEKAALKEFEKKAKKLIKARLTKQERKTLKDLNMLLKDHAEKYTQIYNLEEVARVLITRRIDVPLLDIKATPPGMVEVLCAEPDEETCKEGREMDGLHKTFAGFSNEGYLMIRHPGHDNWVKSDTHEHPFANIYNKEH